MDKYIEFQTTLAIKMTLQLPNLSENWKIWANKWLSGEDKSSKTAAYAAYAAAAAAYAANAAANANAYDAADAIKYCLKQGITFESVLTWKSS